MILTISKKLYTLTYTGTNLKTLNKMAFDASYKYFHLPINWYIRHNQQKLQDET